MKVLIITQARIGSSRLPNKVLRKIGTETMLSLHLKRLLKSKKACKIVVATTNEKGVDKIIKISKKLKVDVFQGSTNDVLDRFYKTAVNFSPSYIVRVTSDCPLIDPMLIDKIIDCARIKKIDYCSNIITEDFPDGQDIEVFKFSALETAWHNAFLKSDREHVTTFIRNNSNENGKKLFSAHDIISPKNYNNVRMTVDELKDLEMINWLVSQKGTNAKWRDYADFILENINVLKNAKIKRNEGYLKSLKKDTHE